MIKSEKTFNDFQANEIIKMSIVSFAVSFVAFLWLKQLSSKVELWNWEFLLKDRRKKNSDVLNCLEQSKSQQFFLLRWMCYWNLGNNYLDKSFESRHKLFVAKIQQVVVYVLFVFQTSTSI